MDPFLYQEKLDTFFGRVAALSEPGRHVSQSLLDFQQEVAKELLEFDDRQLAAALTAGEIVEIKNDDAKAKKPHP
jgi:hypothetical protein